MKIHTLDTGLFKLDGGAMFGVVPKTIWSKLNPADENNLCTWAMRCMLIEMGSRLILVDTGIGDKQDDKFFSHYYLHGSGSLMGSIKKAGFTPDEVTDVFLTHLHFDHVGGAIRREDGKLVPTFKNAKYWSNRRHWDWAVHPNAREKASFLSDNILPIEQSGQLNYVENFNSTPFGPGFDIIYVDGHTERMMLPLLTDGGKKYLYCADLFPSAAHLPLPYVMGYDMRPLITLKEKEFVLARCVREGISLLFEHDAHMEGCTLQMSEKGIRMGEAITV
jgi:glyoxylase-like metal-dependent hydrolase (beta-lactamase superfamily II)